MNDKERIAKLQAQLELTEKNLRSSDEQIRYFLNVSRSRFSEIRTLGKELQRQMNAHRKKNRIMAGLRLGLRKARGLPR